MITTQSSPHQRSLSLKIGFGAEVSIIAHNRPFLVRKILMTASYLWKINYQTKVLLWISGVKYQKKNCLLIKNKAELNHWRNFFHKPKTYNLGEIINWKPVDPMFEDETNLKKILKESLDSELWKTKLNLPFTELFRIKN